MQNKNIFRITTVAMLSALAIVSLLIIKIPMIGASFLKFDIADIPILIVAYLLGPIYGLVSLAIVCFFQAFILGDDVIVGFLMHFISSSIMIVILSVVYQKFRSYKVLLFASAVSVAVVTLIMVILNLTVTVHFYGIPRDAVIKLLPIAIIPFNLIKTAINTILSVVILKILNKYLKQNNLFSNIFTLDKK